MIWGLGQLLEGAVVLGEMCFHRTQNFYLRKLKHLKKFKTQNLKTCGTPPEFTVHRDFFFVCLLFLDIHGHAHQRGEGNPIEKAGWQDVLLSP